MKKINFLKIIDLIQSLLYYGALLFIPLSFASLFPLFSPFTLIKSTWFYVLGALFLLITIISFQLDKERMLVVLKLNFWKRLLPILFILLGFFIISFFSVNFQQSFFGSYDRQLGIMFYSWMLIWMILIVHYFHSYLFSNHDPEQFWLREVKKTAVFMVVGSSMVSVYAFLQYVGYDLILWQEPQLLSRSISSLGQPNFLASFLLFGLAMSAYLFYLYNRFLQKSLLFILMVLQITALVLSGSRSAWLAFIVVLFFLGTLFLWRRFKYKAIIFTFLFVFLALFLFYLSSPERVYGVINWREGSVGLRTYFYQISPDIISHRPLVGLGLENGGEVVVKYYQPEWGLFARINSYTDKVHNSLLDITIQTGFLGLIFYILLHIFLLKQWLLLWRRKISRPFALAAGSALIAYGITLFFGLADITNVFYFWVLAALIIAGNTILNNEKLSEGLFFEKIKRWFYFKGKLNQSSILVSLLSALFVIIALAQIYFSFGTLKADHYFLSFYKQSLNKEYFTADLLYSYILEEAVNPVNLSHYQRVYAYFIVDNFDENFNLLNRRLFRERAKELSFSLKGDDYETLYSQARLKCFLQGASAAQDSFDHLKSLSPNRPAIYLDQGDCEFSNPDRAIVFYGEALERLPSFNDKRLVGEHLNYFNFYSYSLNLKLADAYYTKKDYSEALSFYQKAYFFNPQDISLLKKIANSYFFLGDYDGAYSSLEHAYNKQVHHYWLIQLSALSIALGDRELADKYWQKVNTLVNEEELGDLDNLIFP